jgi:multicomponent Na+:H+ antiporter subunit G
MIWDVVGVSLIAAGVLLLAVSAVGLIRLPDFYSRAHAVTKSETLGLLFVLVGLVALHRLGPGSAQMLFIAVFALVANATAMHALARAAFRTETEPWTRDTA